MVNLHAFFYSLVFDYYDFQVAEAKRLIQAGLK